MNTLTLRRYGLLLFVCAVIPCLSGCVEIDAPLVDPQSAHVDENLSGVWTRTSQNDKGETIIETYTLGACEPSDNQPSGMNTSTSTEFNAATRVTTTGDKEYFVTSQDNNGNSYVSSYFGLGPPDPSSGEWVVSRFHITGDKLHILSGQSGNLGIADKEDSLIKQGILVGTSNTPDGKPSSSVATQASMVMYLNANSGDDLFPPDPASDVVYTRLPSTISQSPANSSPATQPAPDVQPASGVQSPPAVQPTQPVQPATTAPPSNTNPMTPAVLSWIVAAFAGGIFVAWMLARKKSSGPKPRRARLMKRR